MSVIGPTKEELEKNINELTLSYNANVENLSALELELTDIKDKGFVLLKNLYEQRKFSSFGSSADLKKLENEYLESIDSIKEKQTECYKKQSTCFKQLQTLRQLQHTYLVGIINGLQKEISNNKETDEINVQNLKTDRIDNL